MNVRKVLIVHALITLVAAVVLVLKPTLIPDTIEMPLIPQQYLLCYFLAAGELSLACLSFFGARLKEGSGLQLVVLTLQVFHGSTAALELVAYAQGFVGAKIFANVLFRILIMALLFFCTHRKTSLANEK